MADLTPSAPEPLTDRHDLAAFDCGVPDLNEWLKNRARAAQGRTARSYVVVRDARVVAYYCMMAGQIERAGLPSSKLRRNMPDTIPVLVIGRLAVDQSCHGLGYGRGLLKDAVMRGIAAAEQIGVRAIVINAKSDAIAAFYRRCGFLSSSLDAQTLILPIETAVNALPD